MAPSEEPDGEADPKPVTLGGAVGRSFLRALVLGVALGVVLPAAFVTIVVVTSGFGSRVVGGEVLAGAAMAGLSGFCAGLALAPMALVESLATRSSSARIHFLAALATFPLGVVVLALVAIQAVYAVTMIESGDPGEAGRQALRFAGRLPRIQAEGFFMVCAFLPAVPLTTYFRLRGLTRVQQLWRVVPGTAVLAFAFALVGTYSHYTPYNPWSQLLLPPALSTIIGVLLPGTYVRGDQLEGWALRKVRAWQE